MLALAVDFRGFRAGFLGHLNAERIDPGKKAFRRGHAVFESLLADQSHRFDQRARGVAEQDPVDGKVDVGFQAGGIQEVTLQIQRLLQLQLLRLLPALTQELVLGVLRWQAQLDFLIEHYSRRTLSKLDGEVVITLRLGLYQLRFLSRVPPHAAVSISNG